MSRGNYPNAPMGRLGYIPPMELTRENQLALIDEGLERKDLSQRGLEKLAGVKYGTIKELRRGKRAMAADNWQKISRVLHGEDMPSNKVPVLSYVGAGAKVYPIDDHAPGGFFEEVEPPTGHTSAGIIALIVRGDSMEPMMEDGWLIFFHRESDGVPPDCIGEWSVVKLEDDCLMVKKVRHGSKPGYFHLFSKNPNHEPIIDVKLKWASRVIDIRPR
jgi:phage repressor protein C with HTH and peptisase S24 domain